MECESVFRKRMRKLRIRTGMLRIWSVAKEGIEG